MAVEMIDCRLITLVPATKDDYEFSYHVKKVAEGEYIKRIWGWDEALQRDFHQKHWRERQPDIIKYGSKAIGTLSVVRDEGGIQIRQFYILPEYQKKGIGSYLLQRILKKADEEGLVSRLSYFKGNPVESLYKRNGFHPVKESRTHYFAERKPLRE
ncbi:MAG: GNAT family N-acetyltransferase [Proteobacteria bacterium]|nr:GNAT family N-acetyltransferase [Pseudomonadota bacterium]